MCRYAVSARLYFGMRVCVCLWTHKLPFQCDNASVRTCQRTLVCVSVCVLTLHESMSLSAPTFITPAPFRQQQPWLAYKQRLQLSVRHPRKHVASHHSHSSEQLIQGSDQQLQC
jgi:hypothetical protein